MQNLISSFTNVAANPQKRAETVRRAFGTAGALAVLALMPMEASALGLEIIENAICPILQYFQGKFLVLAMIGIVVGTLIGNLLGWVNSIQGAVMAAIIGALVTWLPGQIMTWLNISICPVLIR